MTHSGFSAYSPDLPGCIASGTTRDEVEREMEAAIQFQVPVFLQEHVVAPAPHGRDWA